jgi:hypothetical protein
VKKWLGSKLQAFTTSFTGLKSKIAKRTEETAGAPDTSTGFCSEINIDLGN